MPPGRARAAAGRLAAVEIVLLVGVLVAATAWLCAPWAWDASWILPQRDAAFSALALHHLHDVLTGRATLADSPLGWPFRGGFVWTDWVLGQAVLTLPFRLADSDPAHTWALAGLLGLWATAVAAHALSRALTGPGVHNAIAALIAGFGPLQVAHAAHANLLHHEWTLLAPLLVGLGARGRPGFALAGGLVAGASFHFGLYAGLHTVVTAVAALVLCARGRALVLALVGLAAGLLTVVPVGAAYLRAAGRWGLGVDPLEAASTSWTLRSLITPTDGALLHGRVALPPLGDPTNPGFLALALAVVGLALGRGRAWIGIAGVAVLAALLALGPHLAPGVPGPAALLGNNVRAPVRWMFLFHGAVALWAAAAVGSLARHLPSWSRPLVVLPVLACLLLELPRTSSVPAESVAPDPAYRMVAASPISGPLFERFGRRCTCDGTPRLLAALRHGHALAGGYLARTSPLVRQWNRVASTWPRDDAVTLLALGGIRLVLEHPPLPPDVPPGTECRTAHRHRLCVVPERHLPPPGSASPDGTGAWVGMRWAGRVPPVIVLSCGGHEERFSTEPWELASQVRGGIGAPLDLFLEVACASPPVASEPGGVPLRLR